MKKFIISSIAALMLSTLAVGTSFAAGAFPQKDIKFIVPFAPGGGTDTLARILSAAAGKDYFGGHSLVVENMAGGGAVIGQTYVAKTAEADGYTVILYANSQVTNVLLKKVSYTYEDFRHIIGCVQDPEIIAVPSDSPYNTLEEIIEAAKSKSIKVATPGHSTSHHINALNLARVMGLKFAYIHNDSAAMQLSQLMGGHVDVAFMAVSEVAGAISSGKAKGIAIMASARSKVIPDVPTFLELGYEGWLAGANRGVACRSDVPEEIFQYLVDQFTKIATSQEYIDMLEKAGVEPCFQGPEEFKKYYDLSYESILSLKPELGKK